MSARTAKYVEALIREGDSFDYDEWLKRVREQEAEANQRSAALNLSHAAAEHGNQARPSHPGRGAAALMTRNLHVSGAVRKSGQRLRALTPAERLRRRLEKVEGAGQQFQRNRARDAVYDYLEAVFAIVMHFKMRRRTKKLLRWVLKFAGLPADNSADSFTAIIRATSGDVVDNKMVSKWARALRYAACCKPAEMRLKAFMKAAGGVNACAAGYATRRRRYRPS
jgi:hypothetical protein